MNNTEDVLSRYPNRDALRGSRFEQMIDNIFQRIGGQITPTFETYEWLPQHELEDVLFVGRSRVGETVLTIKVQEVHTPEGVSFKCFQYSESPNPDVVLYIDTTGHPVDAETRAGFKFRRSTDPRKL